MKVNLLYKATSLEDAYEMLVSNNKNMIIAGGAWIKLSVKSCDTLIDLENLNLNKIEKNGDFLEIGALCTLREVETNKEVSKLSSGLLSSAIHHIMGVGVRNLATIGGSVIGKFGFSDLIGPLLVMNAKLVFFKQKEISLKDYLSQHSKEKDILLKVLLPISDAVGFFKKVAITSLDFAVLNIALSYENSKFLVSVGARPQIATLCENAQNYLNTQKEITEDVINEAIKIALDELTFGTNSRASKEYRENLAKVYIKRGIKEVISFES